MKPCCAIALFALTLFLSGCASMHHDPLQAAYDSGEISRMEYDALVLERDEALARSAPAHWELQHTISQNHSRLARD